MKAGVELEKGAPAQVHPQVGGKGNLQPLVLQPVLPIGMINFGLDLSKHYGVRKSDRVRIEPVFNVRKIIKKREAKLLNEKIIVSKHFF